MIFAVNNGKITEHRGAITPPIPLTNKPARRFKMANSIICEIKGCGNTQHANGYCSSHYDQLRRNGHPLKRYRSVRGEKLIWLRNHSAHEGNDCLTFPFKCYETVNLDGIGHRAANIMLRFSDGNPPTEGHECAHSCGNAHKGCVNPQHLRWATSKENTNDQRNHGTFVKGERHGMSKLTERDVREIRTMKGSMTQAKIGQKFGVAACHVSDILSGKAWGWLDG